MNKIIKFIVLTLVFSIYTPHAKPNLLTDIYGLILGSKDADAKYTQIVHQALKDLGSVDETSVAVKQMNTVGPMIALQDLSSFTAFGIWLNQKYLKNLDAQTLKFLLYHEASHYIQKHHQKIILVCMLSLLPLILELYLLKKGLSSTHPLLQGSALALAGLLSVVVWYKYFLPYLIKKQEKKADLMAAKALIETGEAKIVDDYIKILKESKSEDDLWWYSDKEKAEYLEKLKKNLNSNANLATTFAILWILERLLM
jgi:Zn-dependent protease with chaperone function